MKPVTLLQASALLILAVFGAVAGTKSPPACPSIEAAQHCDITDPKINTATLL